MIGIDRYGRRAATRAVQLPQRLAALETAVEQGAHCLPEPAVTDARQLLARAGERLRLSGEHTVVALAGATGSGKSSLFNALSGTDLATVGVRRPTTGEPLACVWGAEGAGPLLDWLGVRRRHELDPGSLVDGSSFAGLVLLDLPDHDSTVLNHRLQVDRLVEMVDLLVWVVDPQKYADAALHDRYLRRLGHHGAVTVVVLNRVDTLGPVATAECVTDLRHLLEDDGLGRATVLPVSARTGEGLPALRGTLAAAVDRRVALTERISADVTSVVDRLSVAVGSGESGDVGRRLRREVVEALSAAAGVPAVVDAVARSFSARTAAATGWPPARWVHRLRADPLRRLHLETGEAGGRTSLPVATPVARAQVGTAVRRVADAASDGLPLPWVEEVRAAARPDDEDLADALDRAVGATPLSSRRDPWWWPVLGGLQWLSLAAALVGLLWLVGLGAWGWFQLPELPSPYVGRLPLPTVLLAGGVLLGLLVALVGRLLGRVGARRRALQARGRLRSSVEEVAVSMVLDPVSGVLDRHRAVREALERADG